MGGGIVVPYILQCMQYIADTMQGGRLSLLVVYLDFGVDGSALSIST